MNEKKPEDGVSPVIGVMLMLVVTIIIAAVVSAFATGFATEASSGPNAQLHFSQVVMTPHYQGLEYEHMGGDVVDLRNLIVRIRTGNTHGEINYNSGYSMMTDGAGNYLYGLDSSITGPSGNYPRFQKVGHQTRGSGNEGGFTQDNFLRAGEKFRIYFDLSQSPFCSLGYRDGDGGSFGLYWGEESEYVIMDKESETVLAQGLIPSPKDMR